MIKVSSTECRKRFHKYVRMAEGGEVIVVTRYGKPVFQLQPRSPVLSPHSSKKSSKK